MAQSDFSEIVQLMVGRAGTGGQVFEAHTLTLSMVLTHPSPATAWFGAGLLLSTTTQVKSSRVDQPLHTTLLSRHW